jgi:5-methylcytosine-specific restriction endonuclease McrA
MKRMSDKRKAILEEKRGETEKMWGLFDYLWSKLPKQKKCQSCGGIIRGENLSLYWDHLLEKSKYPEFMLEEENIFFVCGDCHTQKTNGFPTPRHQMAIDRAKKLLL